MKNLSWNEVLRFLFYGIAAFMANRATGILDKLESSVNDLNVKLAVVVTKTDTYETRFDRQDVRIRDLEIKTK